MARFKDNTDAVLTEAKKRSEALLEVAGSMVENTAIDQALVDTGFYRGSMFHEKVGDEMRIGAWAEYAGYIEAKSKPVLRISLVANIAGIRKLFNAKNI